jgi:hypothetical protein
LKKSFLIWNCIIKNLLIISKIFERDTDLIFFKFKVFISDLLTPLYYDLDWKYDNSFDETRFLIFNTLLYYDYEQIINFSNQNQNITFSKNLQQIIFSTIIKFGNHSQFQNLYNIFNNSNNYFEKLNIIQSLSFIKFPDLIQFLLEYIINVIKNIIIGKFFFI